MRLSPGTRFGPYEVVGLLGAGGMGEVYRARDPRLAREVAVKVLPATFCGDPARLRRFETEARAAGGLNHPNILAVFDVGRDGETPYVVTELLEGDTLRDRLAEGLPLRKAVDAAVQVAHGLAAAHRKGIVHRDLKPENLFITREGRVKILDFGLAKLQAIEGGTDAESVASTQTHGTDAGTVLGTAGYMSPEQVRGTAVDHRSDIFALGAVLYEMLTGARAFRRDTAPETMTAVLREDVPPPSQANPEVTPSLDRIVARCLDKQPEERFQSARDLAFALEALSGSAASGVMKVPEIPRRRRWGWIVVVSASVLGALAGAFAARPLWETRPPVFTQLTFRHGTVESARFAPDGQTVVYAAAWDRSPLQVYTTRPGSRESRPLNLLDAHLLSVSSAGELAIGVGAQGFGGMFVDATLARVPLAGGAPREVLDEVAAADWAPGGEAMAVVRRGGSGWRLEYPAGTPLVESEGLLSHARVSPDGDRVAYVQTAPGDYFTGSLEVVARDKRRWTLAKGLYYARGIAWGSGVDEVWFSTLASGGSSEIRAATLSGGDRVVARFPGWTQLRDRLRDGRVLLNRISLRTSTIVGGEGIPEQDLSWHDSSTLADLSADGRTVLFNETVFGGGGGWGVYLRRTDGSPAVRLGDGFGWALSPDGRWVLTNRRDGPRQLILLPTGAGDARPLDAEAGSGFRGASWFPDSQRVALSRLEKDGRARVFVHGASVGPPTPTPVTGQDLRWPVVSPDGRSVAAVGDDGLLWVYALADGVGRPIPDAEASDVPLQWTPDGRALYVYDPPGRPTRVFKLGVTGGRTLWKEFTGVDPVGFGSHTFVAMNPAGTAWAYSFTRSVGELYLVEGLR